MDYLCSLLTRGAPHWIPAFTLCAALLAGCGGDPLDRGSAATTRAALESLPAVDDSYESNDDLASATDLEGGALASSWAASWVYKCISIPDLRAVGTDADLFRFDTQHPSRMIGIFNTDGPLQVTLNCYEHGQTSGRMWSPQGFATSVSSAVMGHTTYSTGAAEAGDCYLAAWREAEGTTRYGFTLCVQEDPDDDERFDPADNCPTVFNPDQADYNGDGVGDACDVDPVDDPCTAASAPQGETPAQCRSLQVLSGGQDLYVYRSFPLDQSNAQVNRAIIVVHGLAANAPGAFNNMMRAIETNNQQNNTLLVAPHFMTAADPHESATVWWSGSGAWTRGDRSSTTPRIASYEAVDELIQHIRTSGYFPGVQEIVVAGHSAGGQFTQRYAAGTMIATADTRYVVANPSSYMFLNDKRVVGSSWAIPSGACSYNTYKYGPVARNWYMNQVGARDDLRAQFIAREVYYIIGALEASCACDANSNCGATGSSNCASLDCSPEAQAQGNNRHERAHSFHQSLNVFYPAHVHKLYEIPGVGHTSQIYFCGDTPRAIFGSWARADGC